MFGMYGRGLGRGFLVVYCVEVSLGVCVGVETWIIVWACAGVGVHVGMLVHLVVSVRSGLHRELVALMGLWVRVWCFWCGCVWSM